MGEEIMDEKLLSGLKIGVSRREFLRRMAVFSLLGVGWSLFSRNPAEAGTQKISKKIAHYQTHPEQGKMCMNCAHFLPTDPKMKQMIQKMSGMGGMMQGMPMEGMKGGMMEKMGLCEVVEGPVSPMGYCRLYSPVQQS